MFIAISDRLGLQDPSFFYYLNQTGCITDPTINDTADYTEVLRAFQVMEIGPDQVYDLFSILASILHIGMCLLLMLVEPRYQTSQVCCFYYHHVTIM